MKARIITQAPFPEGLATTNRVFYNAKGLQKNGVDVKVYIALPTERNGHIKNPKPSGSYKGIDFEYSGLNSVRSRSFFKRRIDDMIFPVRAGFKAISDKPEVLCLISSSSIYILFVMKFFSFISNIPLFVGLTELPFFGFKDYGLFKVRNKILRKIMYKNIDGLMVISYELINLYSKLVSKKCPIILIPVIVDTEDIYQSDVPRSRNIVYTGPLLQKKDGILTIIKSFSQIANEFPDTNLVCTGSIEHSADREKVKKEIDNSGIKERIILKGFVSRSEMIELLNSAACLVLAKPTSDQADTCFPTKLGEYLATGNPIVVTSTGEIPLYLKDGENAYIAEPDSVESFTQKLRDLLSNRNESKLIGENGKKVAEEKFNYVETAKKIVELIDLKMNEKFEKK